MRDPNSTNSTLDAFFRAKSVAVFGASTNPNKSGYKIVENLLLHKYSGPIYPINPRGGNILGLSLYKSVLEVEAPVDLAIIFVPAKFVGGILRDCITKGIPAAIIEAAGFGEVGDDGKKLREEIISITENFTKIRILGPNCTGITTVDQGRDGEGFFSSFIPMGPTKSGSLAIVSQSGFINGAYYPDFTGRNPNLGLRYVITIGNKMDVNENDVLEYLIGDPTVSTIGIYVESFRDVRRFIQLCHRAHKQGKDVILLRSGFSSIGSRATTSHTGALAGLTKTAAREWPEVRCRAFDINDDDDNELSAAAIVKATTHYKNPDILAEVSRNLGEAMVGIQISSMTDEEKLANRGW